MIGAFRTFPRDCQFGGAAVRINSLVSLFIEQFQGLREIAQIELTLVSAMRTTFA
jgi:hypothetical protein